MIEKKIKQFHQQIRKEHVNKKLKEQRIKIYQDIEFNNAFIIFINLAPQYFPPKLLQHIDQINVQHFKLIEQFSKNLKVSYINNFKLANYLLINHHIFSQIFLQKTINYLQNNEEINDKQFNNQLFIYLKLYLLETKEISLSQIETMNKAIMKYYNYQLIDYSVCAQFLIVMIPFKQECYYVSLNLKNIASNIITKSFSSSISKLLRLLIQQKVNQGILCILNPCFPQFMLKCLKSSQDDNVTQGLKLFQTILKYQDWRIMISTHIKPIISQLIYIISQRNQNQLFAVKALYMISCSDKVQQLQQIFNEVNYQEIFQRIHLNNKQLFYTAILGIVELYFTNVIWDQVFHKSDIISKIFDIYAKHQHQKYRRQYILFENVVELICKFKDNVTIRFEDFLKIANATKSIEVSQKCFEKIMELEDMFKQCQ